ncbi:hypothetical protein MMARE11_43510 [Mycobacterium marinum E11]|nr:hypothetical protein MMARE11_43510 [Mycobacterium marinum E11]
MMRNASPRNRRGCSSRRKPAKACSRSCRNANPAGPPTEPPAAEAAGQAAAPGPGLVTHSELTYIDQTPCMPARISIAGTHRDRLELARAELEPALAAAAATVEPAAPAHPPEPVVPRATAAYSSAHPAHWGSRRAPPLPSQITIPARPGRRISGSVETRTSHRVTRAHRPRERCSLANTSCSKIAKS